MITLRFIGITMVSLNHQLLEELRLRTQLPPSVSHGILVYKVQFRQRKSSHEVINPRWCQAALQLKLGYSVATLSPTSTPR